MDEMRRVCGEERRNVSAAARTMCLERLGVVQSEIGGLALLADPLEFGPAARSREGGGQEDERERGREGGSPGVLVAIYQHEVKVIAAAQSAIFGSHSDGEKGRRMSAGSKRMRRAHLWSCGTDLRIRAKSRW